MSSFRGELWNVKASVLGLRNTKTRDRRNLEVKDITHSIIKCRLTEYESADWSVSVFVVECPVEGFSLTMRWMNDSAVTIKNIHALRLMIPKASIKETTRTLTFNCFISTIRMHNICASCSGADPGIFAHSPAKNVKITLRPRALPRRRFNR